MPEFPLIIDGGTGTELERLGVPMNSTAWSAEAILTHPDTLLRVHEAFLNAGAGMVIANTFSCGLHNLHSAGLSAQFETVNRQAVELAVRSTQTTGRKATVAGAISTTTFSGPLDYSRLPSGNEAIDAYARQAIIQKNTGAELIILEMMRGIPQTSYALAGALNAGVPVWVGFSCTASADGDVYLMDTDIQLSRALNELDLSTAQAVGIMHTLIEHTPPALKILQSSWNGITFAYPHAGHFVMPNWIFQDAITPAGFARAGMALFEHGVHAVGGCCGITPDHIRALHESASQTLSS